MTIESVLCRKLDIRFIDAKRLVNEAKVNLNMGGYVEQGNLNVIQAEAVRLFSQQGSDGQHLMRQAHWELESAKGNEGSFGLSDWQDAGSPPLSGEMSISGHSTESQISGILRTTKGMMFGQPR
eukprot:Nitzschia sp. Nitz4//scaffold130_size63480//32556//32927//NITZ4_006250-RA/size63480-processed-gene-0.18-mRNA-1//1//CDS//3329535192//9212//frame0